MISISFISKNTLILMAMFFLAAPAFAKSWESSAQNGLKVISIEMLREIKRNDYGNFLLIDVEPKMIYENEHIDGAINIPLEEIDANYNKLSKDNLIITYCHCGNEPVKAMNAARKLASHKFRNIAYLGNPPAPYFEYKKAGYPMAVNLTQYIGIDSLRTAAGTSLGLYVPEAPRFVVSSIMPEILYSRIKSQPEKAKRDFVIIDLREKEEYDADHIADAVNIPLGRLFSKDKNGKFVYETLPKDKEIVLYCFGGKHRCHIAFEELKKTGYGNAYYLEGGFSAWKEKGY